MKWKLLLTLPLYLLLLMPITSNAYYAMPEKYDSSGKDIKKPIASTVEKVGKGVKAANDSKFENSLKAANDPVYDVDEKKKLKKPSTIKKIIKLNHIRKHKLYYGTKAIVRWVARSPSPFAVAQRKAARQLMAAALSKEMRRKKKTKCQIGSLERDYITTTQSYKTGNIKSFKEWDVGHYGVQKNLNVIYNNDLPASDKIRIPNSGNYSFKLPNNDQVLYEFEKDHIPSHKAIAIYLSNRDNNGIMYNEITLDIVKLNAISVVMKKYIHKLGRTNGNKNRGSLGVAIGDAKNLKLALFEDFIEYYILASEGGYNDYKYQANWIKAFIETYFENEKMCLFI